MKIGVIGCGYVFYHYMTTLRRHPDLEIVGLAESLGADAPYNRRITELVHQAERAKQGSPGMSADGLFRALTR